MTEAKILRQELHSFIDVMPTKNLQALKPLFSILTEEEEPLIIETDLTEEEHNLIEESVERYHKDPKSFVPLDAI